MKNIKQTEFDDIRQENYHTTTNRVIYKYYNFVANGLCGYCPPNRGCNRAKKRQVNNWKEHRKNQYRN